MLKRASVDPRDSDQVRPGLLSRCAFTPDAVTICAAVALAGQGVLKRGGLAVRLSSYTLYVSICPAAQPAQALADAVQVHLLPPPHPRPPMLLSPIWRCRS